MISLDHPSWFQWLKKYPNRWNIISRIPASVLTHLHGWQISMWKYHLQVQLYRLKHQVLATAANLNQQRTHCTGLHHSFSAPAFTTLLPQPATWAAATQKSHSHRLFIMGTWVGALCIFSKAGIFPSIKGITSQRGESNGGVAFIRRTERGTQYLKVTDDCTWIATNHHPRNCLFFVIKEVEAQVRGQGGGEPTAKKFDFFYLDEKGVVRQAANFTTLHTWLTKASTTGIW